MSNDTNQQPPALQLCIFDERRGDQEGQEADKVLTFYPGTVSEATQRSTVGLAQTFLNFTATFGPGEPCDSIWTNNGRWILYNCEPHIWLLMIAGNDWMKGRSAYSSLVACLHQLHHLICLIHGPIQQLLDQDQTGGLSRKAVQEVVTEYGGQMTKGRGHEYQKVVNPLSLCGAIPLLRLPQPLLSHVQSVVHSLEMLPVWNGTAVTGVLALYDHRLLYSSLQKADTLSMYQLASHAIVPTAKVGKQHSIAGVWGSGKVTTPSCLLHKSAWTLTGEGIIVRSQPPRVAERSSSAGSLSSSTTEPEPEKILPAASVWLNGSKEWCSLLIWTVGELVVIVALPEKLPATSNAAEACLAASKDTLKSLNHLVGHHLQAIKHHHVPSFRYLMTDEVTDSMRASPGTKVATLSKQSLSLTSSVRAHTEDRLRYHQEGYLEVAVWGQNDCWVVSKCRGKRRLFVVLEQRGNEGLIESCRAADGFSSAQFQGLFD